MSDLINTYNSKKQALYNAALEWAIARKAVIEAYVAEHYPGTSCVVSVLEHDLLSLEVTFPGIGRDRSSKLAREIHKYLEGLSDREQPEQGA